MQIGFALQKNYHVIRQGNVWAVQQDGVKLPEYTALTKAECLGYGITEARRGRLELIIHGRDGNVQKIRNYADAYIPYDGDE